MQEPDLKGRTLADRYRIDAKLGAGGMATAWLAYDLNLSRQVVVKVPFPDLVRVESFAKRFELEIKSLIRLAHPHVVHVLDGGTVDGLPYCVLEYLGGGSLSDRLEQRGGRQSVTEILTWLPHIAAALDHVHEEGMIHRDVKPGNILFDEKGNPALADFGIVKACEHAREGLTATGQSPGSPGYMAPEILGGGIGPAYDQYSLAAVVYRCVSGVAPKPLQAHLGLVQTGADYLSLPAMSVLQAALSPEPTARFPTCARFAEAFAAAAAGSVPAEEAIPTAVPMSSGRDEATATFMLPTQAEATRPARSGSRAPWLLAALLGAALLVVGGGLAGIIPLGSGGSDRPDHTDRAERPNEPAVEPTPEPVPAKPIPPPKEPEPVPAPPPVVVVTDDTPPVIRMEPVAAFTNNSWLDISGRVVEAHPLKFHVAGEQTPLSSDGEFHTGVALNEGSNTITLEAVDQAGNRSEPLSIEILLDTEDPVLTLEGGCRRFARSGEVELRGTLRDAHPLCILIDAQKVMVEEDGTFAHRLTVPAGGCRATVTGCDRSGNESEHLELEVTVDRAAPRVAVTAPEDGLITNRKRVEVLARLEDDHPASLTIAGRKAEVLGGSIYRLEVALEEGPNSIEVRGADEAGNETRETIAVILDTIPPTLTLEPLRRAADGGLLVKGKIEDEHPSHVILAGVVVKTGEDGSFRATVPAGDLGPAASVRAFDRAGNESREMPLTDLPEIASPKIHLDPLPARTAEAFVIVSGGVDQDGLTVTVNESVVEVRDRRFSCRLPLTEGEFLIVVTAGRPGGETTRKVQLIVRQSAPSKPPPEVAELIGKLASRDPGERFFAATGLGRTGYKRAAEALEIVLRDDPDTNVRRAAARALAELGAWKSVPALLDALAAGKPLVAGDANDALKVITGQDFGYRMGMSAAEAEAAAKRGRAWWRTHQGDRTE
jgi:serine/threonine protein kinase